jgi:hypothetical protein
MAAAGEAEILAMRLAGDGGAGIQKTRHDGGVDLGHIAFESGGAIHHRHASDAYVIFDRHSFAFELTCGSTSDVGLAVPSVVLVFLTGRLVAGRPRVFDRRQGFVHGRDCIVRADGAVD